MKKTLLLFLLFTLNLVFAQTPVTISSSCETLGYHGTYDYNGISNGKYSYLNGFQCNSILTESGCANYNPAPTAYFIKWTGNEWSIYEKSDGHCEWFLGECVGVTPIEAPPQQIIATNPANTTQPPCNGWIFTNPPVCTPTITGDCTTLRTTGFAFKNNIEIFPNPIESDFTIKLKETATDLKVNILNSLGQIIISKEFSNSQEMKLTLNQPTGIYFAKITNSENQVSYFKLVKK